MTDNEIKLEKSTRWYKLLKVIGDASPVITTFMLAGILALELALVPYILQILNSERAQDLTRDGILKYRQDRINTENQILENQVHILHNQDTIKVLLRGR